MLKPASSSTPCAAAATFGTLLRLRRPSSLSSRYRCLHTPTPTSPLSQSPIQPQKRTASLYTPPSPSPSQQLHASTLPRRRNYLNAASIRRSYTTSTATTSSPTTGTGGGGGGGGGGFTPATSTLQTPLKVTNPKKDAEGRDMVVHITPRAVQRLHHLQKTSSNPSLALRIAVEAGGCHGFQYLISLDENPASPLPNGDAEASDTIFDQDGARVIIDEPSLELLSGASVDFTTELIGRQFKVVGIPGAGSSCGCGTSFDIKI